MSERTERLRDSLLETESSICPKRAVLLTRAWHASAGQPLAMLPEGTNGRVPFQKTDLRLGCHRDRDVHCSHLSALPWLVSIQRLADLAQGR
ncbi:MAG: hypothetical protein ACYC3S_15210 [Chloroflexota bacterium]